MDILIHLAAALLVAAMVMTTLRRLRVVALAAGLLAVSGLALSGGQVSAILWAGLFVLVNAVQLAVMLYRSRTGDMRTEERELLEHVLRIEEPARQRRMLDLLRWRDVAAGEMLIREGQAEPPLVYVASGNGLIDHGGRTVGTCGPGDFLGEMSLISGQRATASVIVQDAMRVAIFDRDALALLSRTAPDIGSALAGALNQGLAAKVMRMNRAALAGEQDENRPLAS